MIEQKTMYGVPLVCRAVINEIVVYQSFFGRALDNYAVFASYLKTSVDSIEHVAKIAGLSRESFCFSLLLLITKRMMAGADELILQTSSSFQDDQIWHYICNAVEESGLIQYIDLPENMPAGICTDYKQSFAERDCNAQNEFDHFGAYEQLVALHVVETVELVVERAFLRKAMLVEGQNEVVIGSCFEEDSFFRPLKTKREKQVISFDRILPDSISKVCDVIESSGANRALIVCSSLQEMTFIAQGVSECLALEGVHFYGYGEYCFTQNSVMSLDEEVLAASERSLLDVPDRSAVTVIHYVDFLRSVLQGSEDCATGDTFRFFDRHIIFLEPESYSPDVRNCIDKTRRSLSKFGVSFTSIGTIDNRGEVAVEHLNAADDENILKELCSEEQGIKLIVCPNARFAQKIHFKLGEEIIHELYRVPDMAGRIIAIGSAFASGNCTIICGPGFMLSIDFDSIILVDLKLDDGLNFLRRLPVGSTTEIKWITSEVPAGVSVKKLPDRIDFDTDDDSEQFLRQILSSEDAFKIVIEENAGCYAQPLLFPVHSKVSRQSYLTRSDSPFLAVGSSTRYFTTDLPYDSIIGLSGPRIWRSDYVDLANSL